MTQDTIKMVTEVVSSVDSCGNTVMKAVSSHPILTELTGGLEFYCFFYAFLGSLIHMLLKLGYNYDKCQKEKTDFHFINWCKDNLIWGLISIICGVCSVFFIAARVPVLEIWMCLGGGMIGGTVAFYGFPVITNPDMWKGIIQGIVSKFTPKA